MLSVVIPSYRGHELTVRAVRTLGEVPIDCEVIVVDDGSGQPDRDRLMAALPDVKVLALPDNGGFATAVNAGFRLARGTCLVALNNDAEVSWPELRKLMDFLDSNERVAAVGPALTDAAENPAVATTPLPRPLWQKLAHPGATLRGRRTRAPLPGTDPFRVDSIRGACVAFRRDALSQVGLFDEQFGMFAEDMDLCRRLGTAGWELWINPHAVTLHRGGGSTRRHPTPAVAAGFRRQSHRSACRYLAKHHSLIDRVAMRGEMALRVIGRAVGAATRGDTRLAREQIGNLRTLVSPASNRPREGSLP